MSSAGGRAPSDRTAFALVVLLLFGVYNANFRDGGALDAAASTLLPASILGEGDLDLDEFRPLIATLPPWFAKGLFAFGSMQERDGHLLSSYPPGGAILAVPVYAVPYALGWLDDWHAFRIAGKVSASLMVALSAGFLFLVLRSGLARGPALLLTAAYALGTAAWPIASQGMWQHGPGLLCLCVALYALVRLHAASAALPAAEEADAANAARARAPRAAGGAHGWAALAGAALGMSVVCRTSNVLPAGALALFVVLRHRDRIVPFAVPAALLAVWLFAYNLSTYGTLTGGYEAVYHSVAHGWRKHDLSNVFSNPLGFGLASVLLSPSKGLLVYSPQLVFGLGAALVFWRWKRCALAPYLALWTALMLVFVAKNRLWWGGTSFGPRYLAEATPALVLLTAAAWPAIRARRALLAGFGASCVLAIAIQALGAFFSPCGWAATPVWADRDPMRHWDWRDPEILRCLSRGLERGPLPFELLQGGPQAPPE